jgi:hypothetical protein
MNNSSRKSAICVFSAFLFGMMSCLNAQEAGMTITVPSAGFGEPSSSLGQQASIDVPGPALRPQQIGVVSTDGMGIALQEDVDVVKFALQEDVDVVKGRPYQATAVTVVKQTLANGSHVVHTTTATVARDSSGRTVRIQKLSKVGPWMSSSDGSQLNSPILTTIFDPVANTHTDFTSDTKVAHVLSVPAPPPGSALDGNVGFAMIGRGPVSGPASSGGVRPGTMALQSRADSSQLPSIPKTESLGTKTIEGIPVTGTKTTTTIPVGAIGNDTDIVISRDVWYSPDLKLVLESTQTDPRFGETSYTLSNIQRGEPDSNQFQVPAGYTIDKVSMGFQKR